MELYRKVRLACAEGMSGREAARHFGISRDSVKKILSFSVPPGYVRKAAIRRELLSNLVFEACGSCGDLALFGGFNSVFECDACDDFGQVIKAA